MLAQLTLALLLASPAAPLPAGTALSADAESLRQAELAFAASVAERDSTRFAAALADDAVFVSGNAVARGRAAVIEAWAGYFAPDGPRLVWHPTVVEVVEGGRLGLSRGPWTLTGAGPDGKDVAASGLFNSVWRRQPDGSWRVVFDAGCSPCPACRASGG